ncbi:IS3 family transposase [Cryobacterium sp. TMT1-19]|nr:IS3 family transposase [Cryobacterium sp. TMT1-19]
MLAEKTNFTITRMVRLLEVSRSGYYAWIDRAPSPASIRRVHIEQKVTFFHGDSDVVYGSLRILADLRADGEIISRKTVASTMRRLGLVGISPKRWRTTTVSQAEDAYPVDAVKRQWDTGALNQVWVGDITYLRTWEGWLYLATVIDAHSRRVIGWVIADHMRTDLIQDALVMAMALRGKRPEQVIFHSDRGTQGRFNRWKQHLDYEGGIWDVRRVGWPRNSGGSRCGRRADRRRGAGSTGRISGTSSGRVSRARRLASGPACRRRSGLASSVTLAGCETSARHRSQEDSCPSSSVRRSRSCGPRALEFVRSRWR